LGGQSVSCKASLAALRLYGYFCDIVVMMLLLENKYDDDDIDTRIVSPPHYIFTVYSCVHSYESPLYFQQFLRPIFGVMR